jgi:hypothetical protein
LFVNATKVILWKKPMWPCISFSDEKCSSKFNDLKTVSISDTVPKKSKISTWQHESKWISSPRQEEKEKGEGAKEKAQEIEGARNELEEF